MTMTARRQRGSVKPLSFYGIKFKLPALATIAPATPLNNVVQRGERIAPDRMAHLRPGETAGRGILDTKPV